MDGANQASPGPFIADLRQAVASSGTLPTYRRLANAIHAMIDGGELLPGVRLPPERDLAKDLSLARNTIVKAYGILQAERLVRRDRGRGTMVLDGLTVAVGGRMGELATSAQRSMVFRALSASPPGVIDLLAASVPEDPAVSAILRDAWAEVDLRALARHHGYFPMGYPPLRTAIAERLSRGGLRTAEDEILITNGAQQAISLVVSWAVDVNGLVVVENPTYPGAIDAVRVAGGRILALPHPADPSDLDALEAQAATGLLRAIYVMPTFHNPTGLVMPVPVRLRLASIARAERAVVIEDHAMGGIRLASAPVPPPIAALTGRDAPVVYIDSLSKTIWGGLRVGWIRAPRSLIAQLARLRASADLAGALPVQAMAVHLLDRLDEVIELRRRVLLDRLELLESLMGRFLPEWRWQRPAGGLCFWVRLPYGSASELAAIASQRGVAIVPEAVMRADGQSDDHVRLPLGASVDDLRQGIERLGRAWGEYAQTSRGATSLVV